jgi:hypothetical protein
MPAYVGSGEGAGGATVEGGAERHDATSDRRTALEFAPIHEAPERAFETA